MNQNPNPQESKPPSLPHKPGGASNKMSHEPLDRSPTLGATIDALLKTPGRLLFEMQEGSGPRVAFNLGIVAVLSLALFGFIMSLFSGGAQLWAVPVKVAGGGIVAGLITLPSLYVFSCLNGMDMTLKKAAAILLAGLALVGLILTGLCPVAWVFTQSTGSVGFMGFLILSFWMISLLFGVILVFKGARAAGVGHAGYLLFWAIIFVTVTLQMSTSLRPLIGPSEETFLPQEKRFFLEHWITELGESSRG